MSDELSRILGYAADEAMRTGFMEICPDHIVLAVIRDGGNDAFDALSSIGLDLEECKHFIESRISRGTMIPYSRRDEVRISRDVQNMISLAMREASDSGSEKMGIMHLLSAMMKISLCEGRTYLTEMGVDPKVFTVRGAAVKKKPEIPQVTRFIINLNNKNIS